MRTFFGIDNTDRFKNAESELVKVDSLSCISSSTLLAGSVTNCVISNVKCNYIQAEDCILINVTADRIIASKGSILYNIASKAEVQVVEGEVLVGVFAQDGTHERVYSSITTDGGQST